MSQVTLKQGTLTECLAHFGAAAWDKDPAAFLAEKTGANVRTVQNWIRGEIAPVGEYKLRTLYVLSLMGYQLPELASIQLGAQTLAHLIVLRVCEVDELVKVLQYGGESKEHDSQRRGQLYNVLMVTGAMSGERARRAATFATERTQQLNHALATFRATCPRLLTSRRDVSAPVAEIPQSKPVVPVQPKQAPARVLKEEPKRRELQLGLAHLRALAPFVHELLNLSRSERARFVKEAGDTVVQLHEDLLLLLTEVE